MYNQYKKNLSGLDQLDIQTIPSELEHNAHLFYIKLKNISERQMMTEYLKFHKIQSVFHYIPLHNSKECKNYYYFCGSDKYTSKESERLLRLPLYYDLKISEVDYICDKIKDFFQ